MCGSYHDIVCTGAARRFSHLFVVGHYVLPRGEQRVDGGGGGGGDSGGSSTSLGRGVQGPPGGGGGGGGGGDLLRSIRGFRYEQVLMILLRDLNTLISIDGNGEKSWESVSATLVVPDSHLRLHCHGSLIMYHLRVRGIQIESPDLAEISLRF
eukprot:COSAG01_NODE_715_length_14093_cov_64.209233_4_plen_153_part_00